MEGSLQTAPKPRELGPGTRIGKYAVIRRLARGGMAEVYLAREEAFVGVERLVALKVILPHMADEARFLSMFKAEARVAATLDHPNIAQVLDAGEVGGEPFLAMEYVHGRTVQGLLRSAAEREIEIPRGCAIALVIGACAGLHYAHERRDLSGRPMHIVHRDVSPSNLMCRYDGSIKLLDFGIAKAASQTSATQTGFFKGKSGYMSPEQCADEPLDRRSDIFNLGILLYELTTARRAFFGDNPVAVINKIANGRFAPPSEVAVGYPPELEAIVNRAMAVLPDDRFPTAEDLQLALEAFVRARKLDVSSTALAALMRGVFGEEPYPSIPVVERTELAPVPVLADVDDPSLVSTLARPRRGTRRWAVGAAIAASVGIAGVALALFRGGAKAEAGASREPHPAQPDRDERDAAAMPERPSAEPDAGELEALRGGAPEAAVQGDTVASGDERDLGGSSGGADADLDAAADDAVATSRPTTRSRARRSSKAKKPTSKKRKGPAGMYP